jgi:hypothetical protein
MKIVRIEVQAVQDGTNDGAQIRIEKQRGELWVPLRSWDVVSGTVQAQRTLLLEDGERVVVEGGAVMVEEYDREQNAVKWKQQTLFPEQVTEGEGDAENTDL